MNNKEYAENLRLVADWFETHPEVAPPHDADEIGLYNVHTRAQMEIVARNFGSCEKEYTEGQFKLKKKVGLITIKAVATRSEVCKKKIVGARVVPETVIPSHVEEIVEWECFETPLLSGKEPIPIDAPLAQVIRHDMEKEQEIPF